MATRRLALELIGHVAAMDALGEAFHDGGLADAGFTDQHGIVFGAAAEHLHDAADLVFAADDGVELALSGRFGEVVGVALQGLIFGFGVLVGNALRAADGDQGFQNSVVSGAGTVEQLAGGVAAMVGDGEQQVLGGDELVFKAGGFIEGALEDLVQGLGEIHPGLHAASFGESVEQAARLGDDGVGLDAAFFQDGTNDALFFFREGDEQVEGEHHLAFAFFSDGLGLLDCFLRFLRESVETEHLKSSNDKKGRPCGLPQFNKDPVDRSKPVRASLGFEAKAPAPPRAGC